MKEQKTTKNPIRSYYKRKKDFRIIDFIALIFLVFFAVLAGISIKDYIEHKVLDFTQTVTGTLDESLPVKVLVIRSETPIKAPTDGIFIPELNEGERIKEGAVIGYIEAYSNGLNTKTEVMASKSGTVHYSLDGLEDMLSMESLNNLDLDKLFFSLDYLLKTNNDNNNSSQLNTGKGYTIAKIIDNLVNYTVILAYEGEDLFPSDGEISFIITGSDLTLNGSLIDKLTTENFTYLVLDVFPGSYDLLTENRYFDAEAIITEYSGIIIPLSAIIEDNEGIKGVYQKYRGNLEFCPVEIIGIIGDQAAVIGVDPLKEIVTNPNQAAISQ